MQHRMAAHVDHATHRILCVPQVVKLFKVFRHANKAVLLTKTKANAPFIAIPKPLTLNVQTCVSGVGAEACVGRV